MTARIADWIGRNQDLLFVAAVMASVVMIFVPLPTGLIDVLLVVSITVSVLVLLATIYVREPLRFSVFPSMLLVVTAFRLSLNIATTRLVLGRAHEEGTLAAGQVVRAFGEFVGGNEPLVGFVIFLILVIVNFVVIAKGAGRVSEVAARFTLDAMPGKQMAIDADLGAGQIDAAEAARRREAVAREADFYGAMDGATKFVRGDAIAGILITLVNIAGGLLIGTLRFGMPLSEALGTFTLLTIGDGLVSQMPALLVALGAGLIVTRATASADLGREFVGQITGERRALRVAAGFLALLAMTAWFMDSGLPSLTLAAVSAVLLLIAGRKRGPVPAPEAPKQAKPAPETMEQLLRVEDLELEVGCGLVRAAEAGLADGVARLRRDLAADLGLVVPSARIRDDARRPLREFSVRIRGAVVDRGTVPPGLDAAEAADFLRDRLRTALLGNAAQLLTRDDVAELLKVLRRSRPAIVDEVVPAVIKPGELQKVLQNLLREGVSIRDLGTVLESIADAAPKTGDAGELTERVRAALAGTLCRRHAKEDGTLYVVAVDPRVGERVRPGEGLLSASEAERLAERLGREVEKLVAAGHPPVVLCAPPARTAVKRLADGVRAGISVLSTAEVVRGVRVEPVGMVGAD